MTATTSRTRAPKVSIQAAADKYNISTRTIRRYIAAGRLPAYRVGPSLVRIDLDDLDRLARPIPNARTGR
jgi:excisionase family DNA binding protein